MTYANRSVVWTPVVSIDHTDDRSGAMKVRTDRNGDQHVYVDQDDGWVMLPNSSSKLRVCMEAEIDNEYEEAMPEPDWDAYPDGDCFIVSPYGNVAYYFESSDVQWHEDGLPELLDVIELYMFRVELDEICGVDWRKTLRFRTTDE